MMIIPLPSARPFAIIYCCLDPQALDIHPVSSCLCRVYREFINSIGDCISANSRSQGPVSLTDISGKQIYSIQIRGGCMNKKKRVPRCFMWVV